MPERSVSAMRAMFEAKGENTSPPSRGRSPAGSERSNGSRNVSNMRSSFVAVEKSGTNGPMLGLRRVSDAEQPTDAAGTSQRGRNPLSRTSSLSNVQEEDGALGNILKGSPFEVPSSIANTPTPRSVPETVVLENKALEKQGTDGKQHTTAAQKVAALAQGTVNKFKPTPHDKVKDQKSADQKSGDPKSLSIATNKPIAKDKSTPASAKTPTSATRTGPAVKVSSPSTTAASTGKPAPRKPTEPKEPNVSARLSRPSLAAKETRPKSPLKQATTAVNKPRNSEDVASLRAKPSRTSLSNVDPEFLSRMSRPTQASASKTEKDVKVEERKPRQSMGKTPDEGFLARMMRPTQASSSKHEKAEEAKKPARSSIGKSTEPGFLERMSRPTAASQNKHNDKLPNPTEESRSTVSTPPRTTKTQLAAAVMKPKQKLEAAKTKVEEKVTGKSKDQVDHSDSAASVVAPSVAPEQTQADLESKRPTYVRVETEKAEGSPHVSAAAAAAAKEEEKRAKRAVPVIAKEDSRSSALDAATPDPKTTAVNETPHSVDTTAFEKADPPAVISQDDAAAENANGDWQSLRPETTLDEKRAAPVLQSQDTDVDPPSKSAGAGEAPGPALEAGAQVVNEAKEEAFERQQQVEGEGHPTDSLAEAVAKVH